MFTILSIASSDCELLSLFIRDYTNAVLSGGYNNETNIPKK